MGTDYRVHIGPYLKVHNPLVGGWLDKYCCPNAKCRQHGNPASVVAQFCFACGNGIESVSFPCEKKKKFDVYAECSGDLTNIMTEYQPEGDENYMFFISNKMSVPKILFEPIRGCYAHDVCQTTVLASLDVFKTEHKDDIAKLMKVFGDAAVEVHFGVLSWMW